MGQAGPNKSTYGLAKLQPGSEPGTAVKMTTETTRTVPPAIITGRATLLQAGPYPGLKPGQSRGRSEKAGLGGDGEGESSGTRPEHGGAKREGRQIDRGREEEGGGGR